MAAEPKDIAAMLAQPVSSPTGWTCPACGKGNAPDVKGCVHCAKPLDTGVTSLGDFWASEKLSIGRT